MGFALLGHIKGAPRSSQPEKIKMNNTELESKQSRPHCEGFKVSLPPGVWKTLSVNGATYDIVICHEEEPGDFEKVVLRKSGTEHEHLLEENNAILGMDNVGGKWLGILSATAYDRHTSYILMDLERVTKGTKDVPDEVIGIYLGGVHGGWRTAFPSVDFAIDFDTEIVSYDDGRIKTFSDCFDKTVDEREAREKLTKCFNESRTSENMLSLFLGKWHDVVVWQPGAEEVLRDMLREDVTSLAVSCWGNQTGHDLSEFHGYRECLFRPIAWEMDETKVLADGFQRPGKDEPMNYVIPRVFWDGFVSGIVEIYLTFKIRYERGPRSGYVEISITQEMELMEKQPIPGDIRYRVHPEKASVVDRKSVV